MCPLVLTLAMLLAACGRKKKRHFLHFFWAFWVVYQPAKTGKKNLYFDQGNVLIHLEAVSRVFLSPYLCWGWHQDELLLGRECWNYDSSML